MIYLASCSTQSALSTGRLRTICVVLGASGTERMTRSDISRLLLERGLDNHELVELPSLRDLEKIRRPALVALCRAHSLET